MWVMGNGLGGGMMRSQFVAGLLCDVQFRLKAVSLRVRAS